MLTSGVLDEAVSPSAGRSVRQPVSFHFGSPVATLKLSSIKNSSYNAHTDILLCVLQILNVYNIFKLQLREFMYTYFNRYPR